MGAPQYFDRKNEIGGAVYVYMNLQGSYDERSYVRLDGAKDSMFGLAVANIKDINLDKFEGESKTHGDGSTESIFHANKEKDLLNAKGRNITCKRNERYV